MDKQVNRRKFISCSLATGVAAGFLSLEERNLLAAVKTGTKGKAQKQKVTNKLPTGKLGKLTVSKIICGGNLIGGYAHSRDLMYVSSLLRSSCIFRVFIGMKKTFSAVRPSSSSGT